jgi:hypothetical protein
MYGAEALIGHGCDYALKYPGTPRERLDKKIEYPPFHIFLGRNPSPEAAGMLSAGLFISQYYSEDPTVGAPPGELNALLEQETGTYLPTNDIGRGSARRVIKIGACRHYWGPKHDRDPCVYTLTAAKSACLPGRDQLSALLRL